MKKRGAGGLLDVYKAQHFDSGISLTRRLGLLFARFSQIGATFSDPQIVTGTLGRLAGAFLMPLVGSPSSRPAFAHLWSLGVPAIYDGSGGAVPIFDSWANKDTDIDTLPVDIGTQTLTAGAYGLIFRGTKDDDQSLVFMGAGIGGTSGGGAGGWYGNGLDGAVTFSASPSDTDALVLHPVTGAPMQCVYSQGSGAWNSATNNYRKPIAYAILGSDLQLAPNNSVGFAADSFGYLPGSVGANYYPNIDPTKWYFFFTRSCYFTTCSIGPGCVLVPGASMLCATVGFVGPTGAVEISGDGDLAMACQFVPAAWTGFTANSFATAVSSVRTNLAIAYGGPQDIGGWNFPRSARGTTGSGLGGQARGGSYAPFDEVSVNPITSAPILLSGTGGATGSGQAGGTGDGQGYVVVPQGQSVNPNFAMPNAAIAGGGGYSGAFANVGVQWGGGSGGGGGLNVTGSNPRSGVGGMGGAAMLLRGKTFDSNIKITSRGGKGLPGWAGATPGTNKAGGGGGGNGGYAVVLCDDPLTLTTDFSPGGGGAGAGGAGAGSAGAATGVISYPPTH